MFVAFRLWKVICGCAALQISDKLLPCKFQAIFVITAGVFLLYDFFVRRQKRKYMQRVIRQDKIMSNVFPAQFRDKLYGLRNENSEGQSFSGTGNDDLDSPDIFGKTPLAEFYPAASVIFADIAGFTVSIQLFESWHMLLTLH